MESAKSNSQLEVWGSVASATMDIPGTSKQCPDWGCFSPTAVSHWQLPESRSAVETGPVFLTRMQGIL